MRAASVLAVAATALALLPLGAPTAAQSETPPAPASASSETPAPRAWVLDGMERPTRRAAPQDRSAITISAARGETEPFQIAVHAEGGRLTNGDLEVSALLGPGDAVIPTSAIARYREHFVRVRRHSPDYHPGYEPLSRRWFPDALLPFTDPTTGEPPKESARHRAYPYTVPAGRTQPFWVDVHVPRDIPAGPYEGVWTVRTDQGEVSGTVTVQVRDFTLPHTPAAESMFGVWRGNAAIKERLLLSFGVQPDRYDVAREPDLVDRGLGVGSLGFWSGADIFTCMMQPPPRQRVIDRAAARHDPRLHLINYTADEISDCPGLTSRLTTYARRLHRAGADQLVTMVPRKDLLDDGTGRRPAVDIWVLLPQQAKKLRPKMIKRIHRTGGELWSYQALVQGARTPSWQIDFPAANFRILPGFLNAAMGYTGVLYWAVDYWRPNPWRDVVYTASGCCFPGEGSLLYPGGRAGIRGAIPSIRLAWIREGIEDYGYVDLLRRAGCEPGSLLDPAASSWRRWTQDPQVIAEVRDELGDAIEAADGSRCDDAA